MKRVIVKIYFCVVVFLLTTATFGEPSRRIGNVQTTVNTWTEYLREGLVKLSETITRRRRVSESFAETEVVKEDGAEMLQEIAKDIRKMMQEKVNAIKRIKMHAETLSCQRKKDVETISNYDFFDADNFTEIDDPQYNHSDYLAQKEAYWRTDNPEMIPFPLTNCQQMLDSYQKVADMKECPNDGTLLDTEGNVKPEGFFRNLSMTYHPQFDEKVNLDFSVIRSTVSVYVRNKVVLNNIRWSEPLDLTFKCNAEHDPTLIWQYFASSSGFFRLYPAMKWASESYDKTYDFRTRSWYTESMTSPKDMIILLDRSGSMTGKRRKISRHIVHDILDTLADNDYVNVLTFANTTEPLITCFNDTLIQANEENLRLIRENLTQYRVKFHGRLDLAFEKAFEILKESHGKRSGVFCNQVIMVITEGVDYFDQTAFDNLKKLNSGDEQKCKVRIFTYLLETLEADAEIMLKIACDHMGYYVNITDVAEIREKVNMYTSVLSRSVNLSRDPNFQPVWSALYVDLADRRLTNWLWQKDEGLRQREIFVNYSRQVKGPHAFSGPNDYEQYLHPRKYRYLTTVSLPVYDRREGVATLLGVAAVDVPIDYMIKLTKPYKLGVNGYAFIITNNGYVLMHPDHRTNFKNILKPTFNRVDLTEVELSKATVNPREFDDGILNLRLAIVNQSEGAQSLEVMTHMDDMKRIFFTTRNYYYTKIDPYSLVIALPHNYGHNTLKYNFGDNFHPNRIFLDCENETWTLHPEWIYFDQMRNLSKDDGVDIKEMLRDHLKECEQMASCQQDAYYDLLSMFLEDLRATRWFEVDVVRFEKDHAHYSRYESLYNAVVVAFMSAHSGLTRWQYLTENNDTERNFGLTNNRSIDEIWYMRSVEENFEIPNNITYIFSIPLLDEIDIVENKNFDENEMVTVTHAILKEKDIFDRDRVEKIPVAVVGYQMRYTVFKALFQNLSCDTQIDFGVYSKENISCMVLDNHGYILWSNNDTNVGRLILHHSKDLTQRLEDDGIFDPVKVFDYQGICFPNATVESCPSSGAQNCRRTEHKETLAYQKRAIQKTIPTPCDKEMRMYRYNYKNYYRKYDPLCPYIVQNIPNTNLVLLIYETNCYVDKLREVLDVEYPKEKEYGETGKLHLPCFIESNNDYFKRPYIKCITANEKEKTINQNIRYCGGEQKHIREEL